MSEAGAEIVLPLVRGAELLLYFDGVSNYGFNAGIVNMTLEAVRHIDLGEGKSVAERVIVAHLRTSVLGLESIRAALNGIDLLAKKPAGEAKN
jgi:hypothetical protein